MDSPIIFKFDCEVCNFAVSCEYLRITHEVLLFYALIQQRRQTSLGETKNEKSDWWDGVFLFYSHQHFYENHKND